MPARSNIFRLLISASVIVLIFALSWGCMNYGPTDEERFDFGPGSGLSQDGVFILNEGRFTYGDASLSYYIPSSGKLENEVFVRANAIKLGDVAQSISFRNGKVYIAVNNSGVVFVADADDFRVEGLLRGVPSPRYIQFLSDSKAYVTALKDPRIAIFDPRTMKITGHIPTGEHTSTEQMALWGKYLFVTCWSYDRVVLVIDTDSDQIIDKIETRIQPRWIIIDKNEKLWVLTDGGYKASDYGYEAPALYRINPATRQIEREFVFSLGDSPKGLALNGAGDRLYFLNRHLYAMSVEDDRLPVTPIKTAGVGTIYYALGVHPENFEIYLGDAIDYSQRGVIHRLAPDGEAIESFRTGITPNSFYFKSQLPR